MLRRLHSNCELLTNLHLTTAGTQRCTRVHSSRRVCEAAMGTCCVCLLSEVLACGAATCTEHRI